MFTKKKKLNIILKFLQEKLTTEYIKPLQV